MSRAAAILLGALLGAGAAAAAEAQISNPLAPSGARLLHDAELETRAADDPAALVASLGQRTPEWILWTVPAVTQARDVCCFGNNFRERRCSLAREGNGWGTTTDFRGSGPAELVVLLEVARGEVSRLLVAGGSCPIDGGGRKVVSLDGVTPARSLDLLERLARENAEGKRGRHGEVGERALAALGYHAGDDAARRLERMVDDERLDLELRKNALFWAGQTRPELGTRLADRVLAEESTDELREQALFVLSQCETPEATARLRRAAESDRDDETRAKALFWLSQIEAPEAPAWIYAAVSAENDREVREQGVFALSQVDGGVDYLIRLLRESDHAEVKRQALFWLGQSDDPRALDELERLLDR